jgi:hypothetical protein
LVPHPCGGHCADGAQRDALEEVRHLGVASVRLLGAGELHDLEGPRTADAAGAEHARARQQVQLSRAHRGGWRATARGQPGRAFGRHTIVPQMSAVVEQC